LAVRESPDTGGQKRSHRTEIGSRPGQRRCSMKGQGPRIFIPAITLRYNFELGRSAVIHQISRSRWRIDTEVFPTIHPTIVISNTPRSPKPPPVVMTIDTVYAYTRPLSLYHAKSQHCAALRTFQGAAKRFRLLVPRGFAQHQLIEPRALPSVVSGNLSGCRS